MRFWQNSMACLATVLLLGCAASPTVDAPPAANSGAGAPDSIHTPPREGTAGAEGTTRPRQRLPRDPEAELRYPFGFGWYGHPWSGDWFWARPGVGNSVQPGDN
jgi:hypothetical protein